MAPEYYDAFFKGSEGLQVLDEKKKEINDTPNDNWAVGLILYRIFKEDIPEWKDLSILEPSWFQSITYRDLQSRLEKYQSFPKPADPDSIGHVIRGLLEKDPKKRMSSAEALAKVEGLIQQKGLIIS